MEKTTHKNGNRYTISVKQEVVKLRKQGKTHREIVKELGISLGSAALWTHGIIPTPEQKKAIQTRAAKSAFSKERREKLRKSAKINLAPYQYQQKYTKENLLKKIKNFYTKNSRIPLKREFNMHRIFKYHFGSWNKAICEAGFSPNPILFAKKFTTKDGHTCDSFSEKIIDDWLLERKILHQRNKKYGNTKFTADFFIKPNIIIEFFGLAKAQKNYDIIIKKKRELAKNLNLKLIEIYPKDIYDKNSLSNLINLK